MALIHRLEAWTRRPSEVAAVESPRRVLLGDPAAFRIDTVHNPLMVDADGMLYVVDAKLAREQWSTMREALQAAGLNCSLLEPVADLPDACFTANPSFVMPTTTDSREVWLGRMRFSSRQGEVDLHARFFHAAGFQLRRMPEQVKHFEGHGDGLWHPGRWLLHAGVGPRTEVAAWQVIAEAYPQLDVLLYDLQPGSCYHLDTALAPLSESCALVVRTAFTEEGFALVAAAFPELLELDPDQAAALLGNAFCADGHTVFLANGDQGLARRIEDRGFRVVTLDLSEFHKAGGSVFCLKQSY